jgi:hypothetical protein
MHDTAIAFLPYGTRLGPGLARLPAVNLIWPLGCPDRLQQATVGDFRADDHLVMYPNSSCHFRIRRGTRARISLVMGEPSIIHAKHLRLLRLTHRRFFRVMAFDETLLARIPNGVFFPYGTTWVPEWRELPRIKSRHCSLIASAKRDTEGHRLRHAMADWVQSTGQDVDVMGRGYVPFDTKAEGLAPYRFSVVIENVRERNYFSEKLVDAVLCNTVPIYWGCPNIGDFIDTSGIIQCTSEAELRAAVQAADARRHAEFLPGLIRAQAQLEPYLDLERRAVQVIADALTG